MRQSSYSYKVLKNNTVWQDLFIIGNRRQGGRGIGIVFLFVCLFY